MISWPFLRGRDAAIIGDTATLAIDDLTDDEPAPQIHAPNPPEGENGPTIPKQRHHNTGRRPEGDQHREQPWIRHRQSTENPTLPFTQM